MNVIKKVVLFAACVGALALGWQFAKEAWDEYDRRAEARREDDPE